MARVMGQRLDRGGPLWEGWLVEGLKGTRWALISKVHHCMVDGVSGTQLYHLLLSTSPDDVTIEDPGPWQAATVPSRLAVTGGAAAQLALSPGRVARLRGTALRTPTRTLHNVAHTARGLVGIAGAP